MGGLISLGLFVGASYQFEYTNHRGETAMRFVTFRDLQYGTILPYYPEPTWLLLCDDHSKDGAPRSFALNKINVATWGAA